MQKIDRSPPVWKRVRTTSVVRSAPSEISRTADVVITDIFMPEKEGIETILAIRHEFPEARIIAISGGGEGSRFSYLCYARQLGATRTLAKPFSPSQLLGVIEEMLGAQDDGRRGGGDRSPAL